ncbi:MAG: ASKHA domain-containing protein [Thermodesulfobacteriota bacterium]
MGFGIAFDIGTTTIVGVLVNLLKKEEIRTSSLLNPQIKWGKDVISRIDQVINAPSILPSIQSETIKTCNKIIKDVLQDTEISHQDIDRVTVVGNPVMEHLFLGLSPQSLGKNPYRPAFKEGKLIQARELGLSVKPDAQVYLFPLISGFVGGDMVALLLFIDKMDIADGYVSLVIDLGTNTEIALITKEGIWTTSAAAGPAFEGGEIKHGMMAKNGAIKKARITGDKIEIEVIGGKRPIGICGSGLLDIIASLLKRNIIDRTGRIKKRKEIDNNLANKIEEGKENSFCLYRDLKGSISINQEDIRALQLAKGAIQAGIKLLMDKRKVTEDEVKRVFIAGAFGNNISVESLADIGVISKAWTDRVTLVGDGALEGARIALSFGKTLQEVEKLIKGIHYLTLSGSAIFQREFLKGMGFDV